MEGRGVWAKEKRCGRNRSRVDTGDGVRRVVGEPGDLEVGVVEWRGLGEREERR